jgi:parallel beta-helix repeat protein
MKTTTRVSRASFLRAACALGLAALFSAGSLPAFAAGGKPAVASEPQPGAIAIGAETTPGDANSVYRLAQPGSYYLTGNVQGVAGKAGIEIAASHVTINLNGFTLQGVANSLDGIRIEAAGRVENITIRNGTVSGWGWYGINLLGLSAGNEAETAVIEDINASRNAQTGIRSALQSTIRGCTAGYNLRTGIEASFASVVENSVAIGNANYGFWLGTGAARGCSASNNGSMGFYSNNASLVDCGAAYNGGDGFYGANGGVFQNCTTWENSGYGFYLSGGGKMTGCSARANQGGGIKVVGNATVMGNTVAGVRRAGGNYRGIHVTSSSALVANNTVSSANLGIHVDSGAGANRIEGNNITGNDVGLKVDGTVNFIARNSARNASKNYQIVANNRVGTIVVPALSAAIDGNSGGGSGTTDPWSNIAY